MLGALGMFLILRNRNNGENIAPAFLANRILRHPERMLLELPIYICEVSDKNRLLTETRAELARMGDLQMRSAFLTSFAQVINEPSKDTMVNFTNFLFNEASNEFRDTLEWEGRCEVSIRFLRLVDTLIISLRDKNYLRNPKFPKHAERCFDKVEKELKGKDKEVALEWYFLFLGLCKIVIPKVTREGMKKLREIELPVQNISKPDFDPSIFLTDSNLVGHLTPFQEVAKKVYDECKQLQRTKKIKN